MKIVVTGATGFIGRHVLKRLASEAAVTEIVAVGRNRERWSGVGRFVELDLASPVADAFDRLGSPDVVMHLAWGGLPNYRSLHHFEQELPTQYAFLQQLVQAGLKRVVVVGTCFEYGMQAGALSESQPAAPTNPYGLAKDTLRRQLEYLVAGGGTQLTWARLFYMWGEGQPTSSLYPQLAAAVARGDAVFNMSGGEQLRDYLPVSRVADCLVRLALRPQGAGVVNVCSGEPISVRTLVERWLHEHGWNIQLNLGYYPYPDYEPMAFWGNREKLQLLLEKHRSA